MAAGGPAGIVAFDAGSGDRVWRSAAHGPAYVAPVLATLAGARQLVCVMKDETVGLDPATGDELWNVPHVRPDQTNYAALTVLAGGGFVVSGQGSRGARRIDVARVEDGWEAHVTWHARGAQFSHGTVVERDGFLYGSNGSMLCALDVETGGLAFKLRGFGESNLVAAGAWTVRVDEEGALTILRLQPERIEVFLREQVLEPVAWAPPTVAGDLLLLRDAKHLVALRLPRQDLGKPLEVLPTSYVRGAVQVPAALIAFAHGSYEAGDGRVFELGASVGELELRRPGASTPVGLTARSEELFEDEEGGRLRLVRSGGVVPEALEYELGGEIVRARRRGWQPLTLPANELESFLGSWRVADTIELNILEGEEGLEASSSAHADVRFRVRAESPARLWLDALGAPYGIPPILIEVAGEELLVHQASETATAVRP